MIKFVTKFNADVQEQMNKHIMKKLWLFYVLFSLIFVALGIIFIADDLVGGIILIAVGVLSFPICLLATKSAQKKMKNSMSVMSDETIETFIFTSENVIIIDDKGEDYHSETRAKYTYLYKIEETATHFFLYISRSQAHVIAKSDLVEGSLDELKEIFAKNLGENYKMKK